MADDTKDTPKPSTPAPTGAQEMSDRIESTREKKGLPPGRFSAVRDRFRSAERLRQQQEDSYGVPDKIQDLPKLLKARFKEGAERTLLAPLGALGDAIYLSRRLDPGQKHLAFKNMFLGSMAGSVGNFGLVGTVFANKLRNQQSFPTDPIAEVEVMKKNFGMVATAFQVYDKNFKQIQETNKLNSQGIQKLSLSLSELSTQTNKTFELFEKRAIQQEKHVSKIEASFESTLDGISNLINDQGAEIKKLDVKVEKLKSQKDTLDDHINSILDSTADDKKDLDGKIERVGNQFSELENKFENYTGTIERRLGSAEAKIEILFSNRNGRGGSGRFSRGKGQAKKEEQPSQGWSILELLGSGTAAAGAGAIAKKVGTSALGFGARALPWLKHGLKVGGLALGALSLMSTSAEALNYIGEDNEKRDKELGITPDMTQEQISEIRKKANVERRNKGIKEEHNKTKELREQMGQAPVEPVKPKEPAKKGGLFDGWFSNKGAQPLDVEVLLDRREVERQKSDFLQFGKLPKGFEFVQGNQGRLGSAAAVAASGAVPIADFMGGQGPVGDGPMDGSGSVTREALGHSNRRFNNAGRDDIDASTTVGGTVDPGRASSKGTWNKNVTIPVTREPASVRYNNPGASYPSPADDAFGIEGHGIIGGGHKIGKFPTVVHGAASNFALWDRAYVGMSLQGAVNKWRGGNGSLNVPDGFDPNMKLTKEHVNDKEFMTKLFKGMAKHEAGRTNPITNEQWTQAYDMFKAGGVEEYKKQNPDFQPTPLTTKKDPDRVISDAAKGKIDPGSSVVKEALSVQGLHRDKDRSQLIDFMRDAKKGYTDPSNAWCASFVNASLERAGVKGTDSAAAGSFQTWGEGVKNPENVKAGDIVVNRKISSRTGMVGSHVSIASGPAYQDRNGKWVIPTVGGNEGNKVSVGTKGFDSHNVRRATDREIKPETKIAKDIELENFMREHGVISRNVKSPVDVVTSQEPTQQKVRPIRGSIEDVSKEEGGEFTDKNGYMAWLAGRKDFDIERATSEKVDVEPEVKPPEITSKDIEPMSTSDKSSSEPKVSSKDIEPMQSSDVEERPTQQQASPQSSSAGETTSSGGGNAGGGSRSFRNNPESKAAQPGDGGYGSFSRCFLMYEWR